MKRDFLLVVLTSPNEIPGEIEYLEGLLEAGLQRLHLRKSGGSTLRLLEALVPRWGSRLVVHGDVALSTRYGVRLHGAMAGAVSRSVHSWEELMGLPPGLEYALVSPVFDSISKPDYPANRELLRIPKGPVPCRPVGLGGVNVDTIGVLIGQGWTGAALLGWMWEDPGKAVSRFEQLKRVIDGQAERIGGGRL